jgi:ATP-binding cassette, subfamily C, bacterial LapB
VDSRLEPRFDDGDTAVADIGIDVELDIAVDREAGRDAERTVAPQADREPGHPAVPDPGAAAGTPPVPPTGTEGVALDDDPLLQSLVWLTRHHGRERSATALVAGLSLAGPLSPQQAVRALDEAGFNAGLVPRALPDIAALLLPAILLLKNGDACIAVRRDPDGRGDPTQYEVVMPGPQCHSCRASEAELAAEYTGVALAATPRAASRSASAELLHDPAQHWFWGTLRRFAPYYRSALVAAMLSNVLMLVSGIVTAVVFDKVIPNQAFTTLWALAAAAALALFFDLAARQLRSHLIDNAGKRADLIVGALIVRQTLGVRMEHKPASAGGYAHHLAQVEVVREFFASATLSVLTDLPFLLLFVAMAFVIGGPLGWVLVVAIPCIVALAAVIQSRLRRSMTHSLQRQVEQQGVLVEAVEGLEDLKAAGAAGRFVRRFEEATAAAAESSLRARGLSAWASNIAAVAQQGITLVMLVWGVHLIADGVITGGALIGAVMITGRAIQPLSALVGLATRYQGARAAMVSLDRLMAQPVEREPGRAYLVQPRPSGRIAMQDVGFSYPAVEGQPVPKVLKGVTLKFAPGERVALVGRIGSGKSTILRMLAGLYQPTEGRVEVDGVDLRQLDPVDFRAAAGFVSQDLRLFTGSLRDNVTMGRAGIDGARLVEVARLTGLERVAAAHPAGWDLPVGEMGGLLSGGQRQLVALARCLVTQPQIVLMDEPTSSMDAQSELLFLRQLKEAIGQRTLVVVTHRPAVLDLVDRLVVVDNGRVVLDGPKPQVLAALSGAKPAATQQAPGALVPPNLHHHPATQPMAQPATV